MTPQQDQNTARPRPLVVLVRPTDVDTDSRAKKLGISLARLGYDVVVLGRSGTGSRREGRVGEAKVTLLVPVSRLRRRTRPVVKLPTPQLRRVEREVRVRLQKAHRQADAGLRARDPDGSYLWTAAQRDFRTTYGTELVRLQPDVIHCHDPRMLPVAFAAAGRVRRATGRRCEVVYDSRENFAGVPAENVTHQGYHRRLLRMEHSLLPKVAAVITVSQDTALALESRLHLPTRPAVVLNAPVAGAAPVGEVRDLRADCGIGADVPLIVYPGAATAPRGVDTMVEALAHDPELHAALVVVPYPHPRAPELTGLATRLGVADRLHLLPPVPADQVPAYLSGADVAVSPILTGPANHEAALPNKLFEMLHSGLPIVTSDIRAMSAFVREHRVGVVFRSGDARDLARAVREVLDDPSPYVDGPHRAELVREWSWQAQEAPLAAVYARTMTPGPARTSGPFPEVVVHWN